MILEKEMTQKRMTNCVSSHKLNYTLMLIVLFNENMNYIIN